MRMHTIVVAALLLSALPAGMAAAQQRERRRPPEDRPWRMAGEPVDHELAETIEQLMLQRFRRHLELTEAQEETVMPLMRELADLRREHARGRRDGLRTLLALAQDPGADDSLLDQRLRGYYQQEESFRRAQARLMDRMRAELTPRQEARLLVFEERFREEMRRRVRDVRRGREGMRPRGPLPPGPR